MDVDSENEFDNLVFEDDDLTWNVMSQAIGDEEPSYSTRGACSLDSRKGKEIAGSLTQPTEEASDSNGEEMEEHLGADDFGYDDEMEYDDHDDVDSDC